MAEVYSSNLSTEVDLSEGFADRVPRYRQRVNTEMVRWLRRDTVANDTLLEAMRYTLLGDGKRIRPLLAYASAELLQLEPHEVDPVAAAVEMIHAYSLVHDDLPAMDDDDLRRGKPTVHIRYDEATAVLVGDALQALAFQVLAESTSPGKPATTNASLVRHLSKAVGGAGMVGGQVMDLAFSGMDVSRNELEDMFRRKTGQLISAAILMPMLCKPNVTQQEQRQLRRFADLAGLSFQIYDDILDVTGPTEQIGKPNGSDVRNDRASYPARFGVDVARTRATQLYEQALACLENLGPRAEGLQWLTRYIVERDH